jgi:hypothetical protein
MSFTIAMLSYPTKPVTTIFGVGAALSLSGRRYKRGANSHVGGAKRGSTSWEVSHFSWTVWIQSSDTGRRVRSIGTRSGGAGAGMALKQRNVPLARQFWFLLRIAIPRTLQRLGRHRTIIHNEETTNGPLG